MKTPQEVYKLVLEHWDDINSTCCCGKIFGLNLVLGKISTQERLSAIKHLNKNRPRKYFHSEFFENHVFRKNHVFWWPLEEQEQRKLFLTKLANEKTDPAPKL